MTIRLKHVAATACGLAVMLAGAGCHQQQVQPVATNPQQQQNDIDSNDHIPAAQKAAIKAQISQKAQMQVQPMSSATR